MFIQLKTTSDIAVSDGIALSLKNNIQEKTNESSTASEAIIETKYFFINLEKRKLIIKPASGANTIHLTSDELVI
jgi:hypothetical protein